MTTTQAITRALFTTGEQRSETTCRLIRRSSVDAIVAATGIDAATVRETLDACVDRRTHVRLGDDYGIALSDDSFDHCAVVEARDGSCLELMSGDHVISTHATEQGAIYAAEAYDRGRYSHCAWRSPVDASYHGRERNRMGEAVCYPEP